ncbi:hypothetical protein FHR32_001835 [Streptosporangium album]|uniref:Uncharacterized protein n=1 Tax=Streptosporangium album TaxID=47479 RepID=A0A7W7W902_9ACTN|nr:hypothetical protein [Streptosporangium album]
MAAFAPPPWHGAPDRIDASADRLTFRVPAPAGSPYGHGFSAERAGRDYPPS